MLSTGCRKTPLPDCFRGRVSLVYLREAKPGGFQTRGFPTFQRRAKPCFPNPVFQGSSCIHCAALHGLTLARKLHDFPEFWVFQGRGCKGACAEAAQSCWSRKTGFEQTGFGPIWFLFRKGPGCVALIYTSFLQSSRRFFRASLSHESRIGTAYDWTKKSLDGTRWRQHFLTFCHCGALVPSLAANGLVVMAPSCVNSLHPSAKESWEEMTEIKPRNKVLYSPGSDQWPGRPVILVAERTQQQSFRRIFSDEFLNFGVDLGWLPPSSERYRGYMQDNKNPHKTKTSRLETSTKLNTCFPAQRGHPCRAWRWKNIFYCTNFGRWKTFRNVPVKYF